MGRGSFRYNVIKIGWLLQSSTCYCLFDLKRKNRHVCFFVNRILSTDLRSEFGFEVVAPILRLEKRRLASSLSPPLYLGPCYKPVRSVNMLYFKSSGKTSTHSQSFTPVWPEQGLFFFDLCNSIQKAFY